MFPRSHLIMFFSMAAISFFIMPFIMIASPFDWFPSFNQAYAAIFMGAAMVAIEGSMHPMPYWAWLITIILIVSSIVGIRYQWQIYDREYLHDMIPHHSMALLTSRAILEKARNPEVYDLAKGIYETQIREIGLMKKILRGSK